MLEIEFPPGIQMMFDVLSLLAVNLKSILQVECLGNLSFCASFASARTLRLALLIHCLGCVQTRSGRSVFS